MSKGAKRRMDPLKKKLRKAEMVSFLTSNSDIREGLANSLYEQGLDRWNKLIGGDEGYFLSFKGVGLKTAGTLMGLAREKRKDFESKEERASRLSAVKELLDGVPRLRASATSDMIKAGFDSVERISLADPGDLRKVKGVGPKLALVIIENAKAALAPKPTEEPPAPETPVEAAPPAVIEEATGLLAEEAPKEEAKQPGSVEQKGFFSRFMEGLKRFFSPAKEEAPKEAEPSAEAPKPDEGAVKEGEAPPTPEAPKPPEGEVPAVTVEAVPEEAPEEAPLAPEPAPEAPATETQAAEQPPESKEGAQPPPAASTAPEEKAPSFFDKLKAKLFGGKKEEAPKESEETKIPVVEAVPEGAEQKRPAEAPEDKECREGSPDKFEDVPGIDCTMAQKLRDSGYLSMEELREAIPEDLMMIEGITKEMAESICTAVKPK